MGRFLSRIELKTSAFINSQNSLWHFTTLVNKLDETSTTFKPMLPPYCRKEWDTNLEEIFFLKPLSKICLAAFLPTPRRSASSLVVIRLSCLAIARDFSKFSVDRAESGRPGRVSFSSDALPFENARTIERLVHDSVSHDTFFRSWLARWDEHTLAVRTIYYF